MTHLWKIQKNITETKMRLLSWQEVPSCVKSKTSAMFSPDPKPPAAMIMGRSSCNALLNIVHAWLDLPCNIDSNFIGLLLRLLELNFNTVVVLPEGYPPKIRETELSYIAIFWACQKKGPVTGTYWLDVPKTFYKASWKNSVRGKFGLQENFVMGIPL